MINNPIIYKYLKDFTNHRKKTNKAIVFSCRPFPNILKGYLRYEIITSQNVPPVAQVKNFFAS